MICAALQGPALFLSRGLALAAFCLSTGAQDNPLEAPARKQGAPGTKPAAGVVGAKITVPDFVKPGARFLYEGGSSTENDDPNKPNSAGVGLTRFDVVAVTETHVLLQQGTFLQSTFGGGYTYGGSAWFSFGDFEIKSGGALWIPKEILDAYATAEPLKVITGPYELNGRTYDTKTLTRITPESAMRQTWDRGTGLKLTEQTGVGKPRREGDPSGFNRKITSTSIYQTYRQMKLPWLDAPAPAWVGEMNSLRYEGRTTMQLPGSAPLSVPFTSQLTVKHRGPSWVQFELKMTMQYGQPSTSIIHSGPGSIGGYWIHPDALRKMKAGVVDEDEMLGTRLEYSVQDGPKGRLGILTESGRAHRLLWGYNLEDGTLVYSRWEQPELNQTIEVELADRQ
jgi:hypothetical protein